MEQTVSLCTDRHQHYMFNNGSSIKIMRASDHARSQKPLAYYFFEIDRSKALNNLEKHRQIIWLVLFVPLAYKQLLYKTLLSIATK